jgi:hypothetical protein
MSTPSMNTVKADKSSNALRETSSATMSDIHPYHLSSSNHLSQLHQADSALQSCVEKAERRYGRGRPPVGIRGKG